MVTSPENDHSHPYRYGRLIDIFTVPIHYKGTKQVTGRSKQQEVKVLWVRWFEQDPTHKDGFSCLRIPRLRFVESDDKTVKWHSFISPSDMLHASHIIPAFSWVFADTMPYREDSHAVRFHKDEHPYFYVNV